MKKGLIICAFAIGAVGAFAFAPAKGTVKSSDPSYHYFDANTGEYLGLRTPSQQQMDCGPVGSLPCADGYNSTTTDENDEIIPVGSVTSPIKKQ